MLPGVTEGTDFRLRCCAAFIALLSTEDAAGSGAAVGSCSRAAVGCGGSGATGVLCASLSQGLLDLRVGAAAPAVRDLPSPPARLPPRVEVLGGPAVSRPSKMSSKLMSGSSIALAAIRTPRLLARHAAEGAREQRPGAAAVQTGRDGRLGRAACACMEVACRLQAPTLPTCWHGVWLLLLQFIGFAARLCSREARHRRGVARLGTWRVYIDSALSNAENGARQG